MEVSVGAASSRDRSGGSDKATGILYRLPRTSGGYSCQRRICRIRSGSVRCHHATQGPAASRQAPSVDRKSRNSGNSFGPVRRPVGAVWQGGRCRSDEAKNSVPRFRLSAWHQWCHVWVPDSDRRRGPEGFGRFQNASENVRQQGRRRSECSIQ